MESFGFKKVIAEGNGKQSRLPRGIYSREEERLGLDQIASQAEAVVKDVWSQHSTVVTEIGGAVCFGVWENPGEQP